MKQRFFSIVVAAVGLLASCAGSDSAGEGGESKEHPTGLSCTSEPIENVTNESRSQLTLGSAGMDFRWETGDQLTVFNEGSDQTTAIYTLDQSSLRTEDLTFARFETSGFTLIQGKRYYAISSIAESPRVTITSKKDIKFSYDGQVQNGNGNPAHLGKYDYMAASGVAEAGNHVNLDFKHLGLTIRVIMDGLPTDAKFTSMEMYDMEDTYRKPLRDFDLESGLKPDGTYTPALKAANVTGESHRFSLKLQQDDSNPEIGIAPKHRDSDGDGKGRLDMFIEVPPADLTNKTLVFMVHGKDASDNEVSFDITRPGRNLEAGKAYQMMAEAIPTTDYSVTLKVNHEWQLGATDSRATGDPGVDEKFACPKYLYYILCVDGNVKAVNGKAVTEIENISENSWVKTDGMSTYQPNRPLTFSFGEGEKGIGHTRNLYVVASNEDLSPTPETSIFKNIAAGDNETKVQSLVYSINTDATQDNSQAFMKNLYSTPWSGAAASFVGNLGDSGFKDIILYHVAAKVDLKWSSAASVIDNTNKTVSVSNVQSTNLSLFQPATVNGTTEHTGTNNYTVTSTIEPDRMYNGRQVFYLPQPANATYNVKIGNKTAEPVTFTPVTTNGFTSWLRWLKNYTTAP